ncbi:39S ribosomal protein L30, mitochondrial [Frankliniella fusca]|uniref:Large ribosomal subunit protein uL30m n=1 Tax=Frankliniella fusca TaxID=407009 RepID=A0AAE1LPR6_9NEOP|nr:39S ribosomal protein L30, mitochondrial [Frankliniella fusca]
MATMYHSLFSSKFRVIYSQLVRYSRIYRRFKRPHEYEFLTNKPEMYPDAPKLQTGRLKYYPRDPNYQDPPIDPPKLFMVQRVKPMKGQPWWNKQVLARLGLDSEDKNHIVILKNHQAICEDLWKVKHVVKITPITFPNGEPTEDDIDRTLLTPDGQMIVSDAVRPDPKRVQAQEEFLNHPLRLDGKTLSEQSRHKWVTGWFL